MLSGAGSALILLIVTAAARQDVMDNSTLSTFREVPDRPRSISQLHVSPSRLSKSGNGKKTLASSDKKMKSKLTLDNNTGLRKTDVHHSNRLPANDLSTQHVTNQYRGSVKILHHRNQPDSILVSPHVHYKEAEAIVHEILSHENNRPGKISPIRIEASQNSSKAAWISNRHPSSLLYTFNVFRREADSKERMCLTECHKERDEREAFCHSDFAVNGIVHDVDTVDRGIKLLTVLVNSGGLYKMNRLYITPDGVFFRVRILTVDSLHCHQPCLHLKLGGRYIIMGQIYHKRMELPPSIQRVIGGRLRAGDGLVTSSRSFIKRFNRKKDRKVLAAVHSKCK